MALYMEIPEFCCKFLQSTCEAVDLLKYYSKDCLSGDTFCCIQSTCLNLRSLYRDSVKPPKKSISLIQSSNESGSWDPSQNFPPLKSVLLTRDGLGLAYLGEPVSLSSLPRGVFVYSTDHISEEENQFSVEILSLGEAADESGAVALSIGLAPLADRKETWSYPNGSFFLHNNGRAVHYNGPSLLQWRSIRLERNLSPGDKVTITCIGGKAMFALNDVPMEQCFEEVDDDLYPVVHIQKKGVRIKAHFGKKNGLTGLQALAKVSAPTSTASRPGAGHRRSTTVSGRPALRAKTASKYNQQMSKHYCLPTIGQLAKCGNPNLPIFDMEDDDDDDDADDSDDGNDEELRNREDMNTLLVKAWEKIVFPAIRRRFRNENERRDGLEQIKGALSLGMLEIARQTVEFLYEENGGIPRDLKVI
jgi:E3 ubiquitin-protein ligase HECTD4